MWKPQLNFAWDIILDQLLPGPNSQRPAKGSFQDFFRVVVDGEFSLADDEQGSVYLIFCRVLIFVDFLSSTQILGFPSLPEIPEEGNRRQHANVVHQKFHAVMDKSSFQEGQIPAQSCPANGKFIFCRRR
jgi:hypothetical protein